MSEIEFFDEEGNALSEDDLAELLSTKDTLEFWYEKMRRGQVVARARIVVSIDTDNITATDMATYRRAVADIAVQQSKIKEEARALGILDEEGKETKLDHPEKARIISKLGDYNEAFTKVSATLLAKLVTSPPVAGKDFSNPETLCERQGLGPEVREELYSYFFGGSDELEEETGENQTVDTEKLSDTTEQTESEESSPANS